MSRTPLRLALALTLLALASGCAAEGPVAPTPSSAAPGPSSTATATAPASTAPAAGTPDATGPTEASPAPAALVVLRRSGGFAGRDDTVTVTADGRWTAVDRAGARRTGRLDATALDRLRRLVADPGLTAKRADDADDADGRCSDTFAYRLTVGGDTVDWTECPPQGAPSPAAAELAALVVKAAVRP